VSHVDVDGKRVREPALNVQTHKKAENHEEAKASCEEKRRDVREERNLKPGEVLEHQESFADVADKFLGYQKARLKGRNSYNREAGIVGSEGILYRQAGGCHARARVGLRHRPP
jgi:hypothetical protein